MPEKPRSESILKILLFISRLPKRRLERLKRRKNFTNRRKEKTKHRFVRALIYDGSSKGDTHASYLLSGNKNGGKSPRS